MSVHHLPRLALFVAGLSACTTTPVGTPPPSVPPPLLSFETRLRGDTITLTSEVSAHGEAIIVHRLMLNGVVVRSGLARSLSVQDTVLPSGSYSFSAEAATAGGTADRVFPFLIREVAPPTARSSLFEGDEAGSISVNLANETSGAVDRAYHLDPPPTVLLERLGTSTVRVRAAPDGSTPAEDVHGTFAIPYTVTDRNGSASGVLRVTFRPQPDITISAVRFLTGEPVDDTVWISLNGHLHTLTTGSRIQGRVGQNIWTMPNQPTGASLVGLSVEGHGDEVPLNLRLRSDTMSFGSGELAAELTILGSSYPGFDAECRATFEEVYGLMRADTISTVRFIVRTLGGEGREAIPVGSESFLRWREAFDSIVAEEVRRADVMNRDPRTFIFTTDLETEPLRVYVPFVNTPNGQPATGQVWLYDSIPPSVGAGVVANGRFFQNQTSELLSATAWSTPVAPVPNRRMALAKWFDRTPLGASNLSCSRHRFTHGPEVANPVPHPMEAALVPLLQARADWLLINRGQGTMLFRQ